MKETLRRMWAARMAPLSPSSTPEGKARLDQLRDFGVEWRDIAGNPVDHIGIALEVAEAYGVEIRPGLTYADCRAILPADKWKAGAVARYIPDGSWVIRGDVRTAICDCLISCYQMGFL